MRKLWARGWNKTAQGWLNTKTGEICTLDQAIDNETLNGK